MKLSDRVKNVYKGRCIHNDNMKDWQELLRLAEEVEKFSMIYKKRDRLCRYTGDAVKWFKALQFLNRARQAKLRLLRLAVKHGVAEEMGLL